MVVRLWMMSAPRQLPANEKRPPVSGVPPSATERMASSSYHNPALFPSALLRFELIKMPARQAHRPLIV